MKKPNGQERIGLEKEMKICREKGTKGIEKNVQKNHTLKR